MIRRAMGACAIVVVVLASTSAAQTGARHTGVPRTADGHPDLQGVWDNSTLTPLERPADLADKEFFPDKAAADYESLEQYVVRLQSRFGETEGVLTGEANGIWRTRRTLGVGSRGSRRDRERDCRQSAVPARDACVRRHAREV